MRPVVIDCDGVLASFNEPYREVLASFGAILRPFEELDAPRLWHWFEAYGASPGQAEDAWRDVCNNPSWWRHLPVHKDVLVNPHFGCEALNALEEMRNVFYVTARPHGMFDQTKAWLNLKLWVEDANVILTPKRKGQALIALEPQVIIEDNVETLREYSWAISSLQLPPCRCILVDRPYNRRGDRTGMIIATDTTHALTIAKELLLNA